jgi:predicted GTPase
MGYGEGQVRDLEATINNTPCDLVLSATPVDLTRLMTIAKPVVHIRYSYQDHDPATLKKALLRRLKV